MNVVPGAVRTKTVMAGQPGPAFGRPGRKLVPAIHDFILGQSAGKTWMPGTRPGTTRNDWRAVHQPARFSFATSLAKVSRRPMVRLNTNLPGVASRSRQK